MSHRYGNDQFVPLILGTGLGAYNVARCLHEAYGVRSIALGRARLPETRGSSIIDVAVVDTLGTADGVVAAIGKAAGKLGDRPILLIPTIEFYTNVLAERAADLPARCVLFGVNPDASAKLLDKADFYSTCAAHGLDFPAYVVQEGDEPPAASELETAGIDYPLILKPSNTDVYPRVSFAGKKKVYLLHSRAELAQTIALIRRGGYTEPLIVQRYISGNETVMTVANTYSSSEGHVAAAVIAQVALTDRHPERVGNNNALIPRPAPDLAERLRSFLDALGYEGFANADFLYDPQTGRYLILELNLRLGATAFYTMAAGINLVRLMVEDRIYGRQLTCAEPREESLWINVFLPAVFAYSPLRARALRAALHGVKHTLFYRDDLSIARLAAILPLEARMLRDTVRHAHQELNS